MISINTITNDDGTIRCVQYNDAIFVKCEGNCKTYFVHYEVINQTKARFHIIDESSIYYTSKYFTETDNIIVTSIGSGFNLKKENRFYNDDNFLVNSGDSVYVNINNNLLELYRCFSGTDPCVSLDVNCELTIENNNIDNVLLACLR